MNPRRVQAITQRLLHQFRRDRRTLALLFGAPLVILGLLGYLLRGGGDVPKMGVVNLDSAGLGSLVASTLESSKTVAASSMSQADADAKLRSGAIAGYVLLPSDFTTQVRQHRMQSSVGQFFVGHCASVHIILPDYLDRSGEPSDCGVVDSMIVRRGARIQYLEADQQIQKNAYGHEAAENLPLHLS